ncbi:MAG: hypothetical protein QOF24_2307 [Verrucomicrobiota bacterium]|jgi:hypothetical protein
MTLSLPKQRAEEIAAIGAVTVATLYALGFGVTLLHYSQFGITSLSLLRAQYVLTGFYLVLPLLSLWAFFNFGAFLLSLFFDHEEPGKARRSWFQRGKRLAGQGALWLFALLVAFILASNLYFDRPFRLPEVNYPRLQIAWDRFGGLVVFSSLSVIFLALAPRRIEGRWALTISTGRSLAVTIIVICILRYVVWFSAYGFPLIAQEYGGGAPSDIRLIVPKSSKGDAIAAIKMDAKLEERSVAYRLLFEDNETYVLAEPEKLSVVRRVKKSVFAGYELLDVSGPKRSFEEILATRPRESTPSPSASMPSTTPR